MYTNKTWMESVMLIAVSLAMAVVVGTFVAGTIMPTFDKVAAAFHVAQK